MRVCVCVCVCVCVWVCVRVCVCARAYRAYGCVHANTNTNAADIHMEAYHMHNPRSHLAYYRAITGGALAAVEAPRSQLSYYRSDTGCMRARMRVKERNEP